jgi:glycosyltransferase involved in cell wall biosynthesis
MVIAVNTRFLLKGKLEGIGWFTHQLVKELVLQHPEHQFIFFFDRPFDPSFVFASNVTPVVLNPPARHPILFYIWFEYAVTKALKKYNPDVFFSTDGFLSLRTQTPTLLTIHDLAFEHYPHHLPFKFRYYLKKFTPKFVKKAAHIIAVSTFTKQDLINTYQTPEEKISVVFNGAHELYNPLPFDERQAVKEKYAHSCNYFVYAGALHPRKNTVNLIKAFILFKQKNKSNFKLLLIGRFAWNNEALKTLLSNNAFKDDIIHYDYMQVDELSKVIASAYALTYVSLFEGFGIPILEALKCNVPCIISNTSSMPEVGGKACLQCNPEDVNEIAENMALLFKNETLRNELINESASQADKFSWKKSAETLWSIIENNFTTKK